MKVDEVIVVIIRFYYEVYYWGWGEVGLKF